MNSPDRDLAELIAAGMAVNESACESCDAETQVVRQDSVVTVRIMHDPWCPELARRTANHARRN